MAKVASGQVALHGLTAVNNRISRDTMGQDAQLSAIRPKYEGAAQLAFEQKLVRDLFEQSLPLAAVFESLINRATPMSDSEVQAYLQLAGSLSSIDVDSLECLRAGGKISTTQWSEQVEPYRKASRKEQKAQINTGITLGRAANRSVAAPLMASAFGLGLGVPGLLAAGGVGMVYAFAKGIPLDKELVEREVQWNELKGMPLVEPGEDGQSLSSAVVRRAASGDLLTPAGGSLRQSLEAELALCQLAVKADAFALDQGFSLANALDVILQNSTRKWMQGLEEIVANLPAEDSVETDQALRESVVSLRARVLDPEEMEGAVKHLLADRLLHVRDGKLLLLDVLSYSMSLKAAVEPLLNTGGTAGADPHHVAIAQQVLAAANTASQLLSNRVLRKYLPEETFLALVTLASKPTLSVEDVKAVSEGFAAAERSLEKHGDRLAMDARRSRKAADELFDAYWPFALGAFQSLEKEPKLVGLRADKQGDLGYVVRGQFQAKRLGAHAGHFEIPFDATGAVDFENVRVDIGSAVAAKVCGEGAIRNHLKLLGRNDEVKGLSSHLMENGRYVVTAKVNSPGQRSQRIAVQVLPSGIVDPASIQLT